MRMMCVPVAAVAAAVLTASCTTPPDPRIADGKLTPGQKAVAATWYATSTRAERERIRQLPDIEVLASVNGFMMMCPLGEEGITAELELEGSRLKNGGAAILAESIDKNLCRIPSPAVSIADTENPEHDLNKPPSKYDREDATVRIPAEREPAWTHTDLGAPKWPDFNAPAPRRITAPAAPRPLTFAKAR